MPSDSDPARLAAISAVKSCHAVHELAELELGSLLTTRRLRTIEAFGGEPMGTTREAIERLGFRPVYNSISFIAFVEALGSAATRPKADFKLRRHAEAGLIAQAALRSHGEIDPPFGFLLPLIYDFVGFFSVHEPEEKVAATLELSRSWGLDPAIVEGIERVAAGEPDGCVELAASQALRYVGSTTAAELPDDTSFGDARQRRFSLADDDPVVSIEGLRDINARVDFLFALVEG